MTLSPSSLAPIPTAELERLGIAPAPPSLSAGPEEPTSTIPILCVFHPNDAAKREAALDVLRRYAPDARFELVQPFDDPELRVRRVLEIVRGR